LSDSKNTSNSQETVITEDPKRIAELEKQLAEKEQIIKNSQNEAKGLKERTIEAFKRLKQQSKNEAEVKTDLTKKVIKQNTFKHNYRNGYADGTVEKEKKKILAERKKAKAGIK